MKKDYKALQIGREFEIGAYSEAEKNNSRRLLLREWTRTIIAVAIVAAALTALAVAFAHGDRQAMPCSRYGG